MIRRFFRHIKEGFIGVIRHGSMAFSSATAMTITLLLVSVFAILMMNLNSITHEIEQEVQISVLVDYNYESAEDEARIGEAISSIEGVLSIEYYSKDEEAQYYFDNYSETDPAIVEMIMEENPLNDAYYVRLSDGSQLEAVSTQIEQIEGVAQVNYGGASVVEFMSILEFVRNVGLIVVAALVILTIFLIQNTIKLTIFAREREISIMRTVGAKNGYIRAPFLVEGIIIGALGSIVPILVTIFGYIYLYRVSGGVLLSNIFVLIEPTPFIFEISLALAISAMIVGLIGSFFSVTKYLRWTR